MKIEPGTPPTPIAGFRFSGVHGGLKPRGRRDFALIVADRPAVCAAAYTSNRAAAAPVVVARRNSADSRVQAVMVNSGNANAATGEQGLKFVEWSCRELASRLSIDPSLVLPCSTGVIGVQLERTPFARAISLAVDGLSPRGFTAAARGIMTSDAFPKWSHRAIDVDGDAVTVAAMAKGAGMINPRMVPSATMLSFVMTDADVSPAAARTMLDAALALSFNRITVDGDTSTNDSVVLLASGKAAGSTIEGPDSPGYWPVAEAVVAVMDELSRMIVRDGEGATKVVDVVVVGAGSDADAERVARAIAGSVLLKTALAGADPNWGRIVSAAGNSGVEFDVSGIEIDIAGEALVKRGTLISDEARRRVRKLMKAAEYTINVRIGTGAGAATIVTSDLTEAYVRFNAAYTS
ncbi:MAG: bifunctional glutamate N-acetyltransferase/amino-acid acetyltransferase ArgJ [Myxococcales bacterium]|nr:MAG: bifunctional glutamate N-acetyltransferase/amino-acid acetyltransferase ArgJ [Myxococcales bacterium]